MAEKCRWKTLFCFAGVLILGLLLGMIKPDEAYSMRAGAGTEKNYNYNYNNCNSGSRKKSSKKIIAIDAGHQARGNSATEQVGPGSKTRKAKVAGGAVGRATRVPEYKFTLSVAKKLRKELISRGYKVVMIRNSNCVNISNKQRAIKANRSGADICIRLHGDSSSLASVKGATGLYPSRKNRYVKMLSKSSQRLSKCLLSSYCKKTKIRNRGLSARDDLTGTNWSKIPVALIEMGFMSNSSEDRKMQRNKFQKKMAVGLANGIDRYFKNS